MAVEGDPAFPISSKLVEYVLLGPTDDRRQLQDSPVLVDVWLAYAEDPAGIQDLLITPHKEATAGQVAKEISSRVKKIGRAHKPKRPANIAYLQGIVAGRLYFDEVLRILVPMTDWWHDRKIPEKLHAEEKYRTGNLVGRIERLFKSIVERDVAGKSAQHDITPLDRYVALAGLILWASKQKASRERGALRPTLDETLKALMPHIETIVKGLVGLFETIRKERQGDVARLIFQISLNRRAMPALEKSVPAVKADAAKTLFRVSSEKIAWAVLDAGIDTNHDAFLVNKSKPGEKPRFESRVKQTFDFTRVRRIVSSDNQELDDAQLDELLKDVDIDRAEARRCLELLAKDAEDERPINWDIVEELITLSPPPTPKNVHGTHVAGIIGADAEGGEKSGSKGGYSSGMCPDIQLYDFRVLAREMEDTEFAIIAALQYIRYLNESHNFIMIHGANLSLSIPHNVRNYACGRTPVCNECERLVGSGVVVVAAAGNRGYHSFETKEGSYEGYAAFSITDPGNADGVITVGATHGNWPHTYGVSFFSSRGPTGDGRLKPDLVAPGERIQAPVPNNEWAQESGTSMAAPHVSGAAAMLMARYSELIGQPRRVKTILCNSATDLGRERSFQGHGMLDVLRAFQSI